MRNRLRLLQGATALLYFGPLLAGLGGFGWGIVPAFVLLFVLWLFVLRPQQWPQRFADWLRPEALIALVTQVVVQVLLVAVCFGIGRGIGGVMGSLPPLPPFLPLGISFLSIPLARMIWDPWKADAAKGLLDEALARLDEVAGDEAALQDQVRGAARMVGELGRLPVSTPDAALLEHLAAMGTQVSSGALRVALMDPIYDGSAGVLHRRAAILHATTGAVADALAGSAYPMALYRELRDAGSQALFARRALALLDAAPDRAATRAADCPDPAELRDAAKGGAGGDLLVLADRLEGALRG